jgi:hypothetical protein
LNGGWSFCGRVRSDLRIFRRKCEYFCIGIVRFERYEEFLLKEQLVILNNLLIYRVELHSELLFKNAQLSFVS